ncbi:MAG: alpha-amylase family glycosyl hydrolase, partial [Sphingopyxis sp.]
MTGQAAGAKPISAQPSTRRARQAAAHGRPTPAPFTVTLFSITRAATAALHLLCRAVPWCGAMCRAMALAAMLAGGAVCSGAAAAQPMAAPIAVQPTTPQSTTPQPAAPLASTPVNATAPWWAHATIYEIYPRSFQDSDGDGVGDLNGVTSRLDYLQSLGVDAIWITPFFPSPNADFGYDIADYTNVAPEYGTLADWDRLVAQARQRGIRVLVDFVVNHTSAQHPWFQQSRASRNNPKRDWYIWHDPAPDGGPPTNWPSIFTGPTWTLDPATGQYYYHIFLPQQPDLNWANPQVRQAMFDVARFWLGRGASGFRLDATPYLFENTDYPQDAAPQSGPPAWLKPYNSGLPAGHDVLRGLRAVMGEYPGDPVLLGESATANIADLRAVYGANDDEINLPMNFL